MTKANKRGPKPKPDHEKQTASFLLKMTQLEYDTIKQASAGSKLSTWARETLLSAAKRKIRREASD